MPLKGAWACVADFLLVLLRTLRAIVKQLTAMRNLAYAPAEQGERECGWPNFIQFERFGNRLGCFSGVQGLK